MGKGSHGAEEYLEALYRRKERGEAAKTRDIAKELGGSAPSVSGMFRKLAEKGLMEHTPYGGGGLTREGEAVGKSVLRKHRLIERFLVFIGVRKNIHEEACVLEHAVSDEVEKKMQEAVLKAGSGAVPLSSLEEERRARIARIEAGPKASLRLADMGLTRGTEVAVAKSAPFGGPLKIRVRGTVLALGRGIASKVFVEAL